MAADKALYNANDGLTGRDGGPYLDQLEDERAEILRAKVEDREPDLDNPPASAGTVLVTAGQLLANAGVNNLPSQDGNNFLGEEEAVKAVADSDENGLKQRGTLPAEGIDDSEPEVDLSMRTALAGDDADKLSDVDGDSTEDEPASEPVTGEPASGETENLFPVSDEKGFIPTPGNEDEGKVSKV